MMVEEERIIRKEAVSKLTERLVGLQLKTDSLEDLAGDEQKEVDVMLAEYDQLEA